MAKQLECGRRHDYRCAVIVPILLLLISLACAAVSVLVWGPIASGPLLMSLICAVAALLILLHAKRAARNWIVIDGSNVLHWDRETPDIQSVRYVLGALKSEGFTPVVWFDANAGYLIADRYMGPEHLARILDLPRRQVFVAPKGTPADPLLLSRAVKLGARVVTNDRFRDWADDFPQISEKGFLVRGRMGMDDFELELHT